MRFLCFNTGSSSLAFALFRQGAPALGWSGGIDLTARHRVRLRRPRGETEILDTPDPTDFPAVAMRVLDRAGDDAIPVHRVVHGGESDRAASWLDHRELTRLDALTPWPSHQTKALALVRALAPRRPAHGQIAVFDTAFQSGMPELSRMLPIGAEGPFAGPRRFGFHGLSHGWVARDFAKTAPERTRVVSPHLSGGSSACAIRNGRSVDTTMGATPLDGLMMGTRSGAVDPGLLLYALGTGVTPEALSDLLWHRSGLKGVSGISADLREILPTGGPRAEAAVDLFARAAKAVAETAVSLGGVDALAFTGGAGAEQPLVRARIVERLRWIGVSLDPEANARDAEVISEQASRVLVRVVPAEEERMMAPRAAALLREEAA